MAAARTAALRTRAGALRCVYREVRHAAIRLDQQTTALNAHADDWDSLHPEHLRRALNIKAWLLPEPFSPEARAFAVSSRERKWQQLAFHGARRASRALDADALLQDGLTLIAELNSLEHEVATTQHFSGQAGLVSATKKNAQDAAPRGDGAARILHVRAHATLAMALDGAFSSDHVERELEATLACTAAGT